jgi:toxin ParE1/3/4
MGYNVLFTESFSDDLDETIDYIANKLMNPTAAGKFMNNVQKMLDTICDNPYVFPLYHDDILAEKGYHFVTISNFLLFYGVDDYAKTVTVMRLIYGKQNLRDMSNL